MAVQYAYGRRVDQCDRCGRFVAKKRVDDLGPNGLGGRQTFTEYVCVRCEDRERRRAVENDRASHFNLMRSWRREYASAYDVAPYRVITDAGIVKCLAAGNYASAWSFVCSRKVS